MLVCTQRARPVHDLPSKPLSRLPQGGEAQTSSNASCFAMESQQTHQSTSPLPIWEGRGIGPTHTPINRHNRGEVPARFDLFIMPPLDELNMLYSHHNESLPRCLLFESTV